MQKRQNCCLALQIAEKRKELKGTGGKKKSYSHLNAEFQIIAGSNKKAFLSDQYKQIEENNRMERLRLSSRKSGI